MKPGQPLSVPVGMRIASSSKAQNPPILPPIASKSSTDVGFVSSPKTHQNRNSAMGDNGGYLVTHLDPQKVLASPAGRAPSIEFVFSDPGGSSCATGPSDDIPNDVQSVLQETLVSAKCFNSSTPFIGTMGLLGAV